MNMLEPIDYDIDGMSGALIKVVGVGGGGGNAVRHMVANMIKNDIDSTFVGSDELAYPMRKMSTVRLFSMR